jgi:hypothetical protein
MTVSVAELITGPARTYYKPFLTVAAEPADPSVTPAAGWIDLGFTDDATNLVIAQAFEKIRAQQVLDTLLSVPTQRDFTVELNLMQATLDNYQMAINGGTITVGTGVRTLEPVADAVATDITYGALIVRGRAATLTAAGTQPMRDFIIRKVANTNDVASAYAKGGVKRIPCTWTAHYVGPSIPPWAIKDLVPA